MRSGDGGDLPVDNEAVAFCRGRGELGNLSAQRYVNELFFLWWCSRDAALRMSSNQRASFSLRTAFVSSKECLAREAKRDNDQY